jgi:hypothetical protein
MTMITVTRANSERSKRARLAKLREELALALCAGRLVNFGPASIPEAVGEYMALVACRMAVVLVDADPPMDDPS